MTQQALGETFKYKKFLLRKETKAQISGQMQTNAVISSDLAGEDIERLLIPASRSQGGLLLILRVMLHVPRVRGREVNFAGTV